MPPTPARTPRRCGAAPPVAAAPRRAAGHFSPREHRFSQPRRIDPTAVYKSPGF